MIRPRRAVVAARILAASVAVCAVVPVGAGQAPAAGLAAGRAWPLTRPEATNYTETSRYDDVMTFMKDMAARSPQIHVTTYGHTYEGRAMPLAVIGAPDATPERVLATGKTRIYIQANIHAGEVEGKEALLWLLRSIAKGQRAAWFQHVVLLINPIYNADGNERVNIRNRGPQFGPVGGMGQRNNAQDLDLNRDNTKLETSEARSMARLLTTYDPHIVMDLHTTDGSDHGFYLTYDTSANPNTAPGISKLVREDLLPSVTKSVKAKHGWDYFYYGGVPRQGERAWRGDLDLYKPRYTQTYWGLRNRIGILSETYSYASFEDRIKADYWFVEGIIDYAARNGRAIRRATADADAESLVGSKFGVRHKLVAFPAPVTVVLADTTEARNPYVPDRPMRARVAGSERTEAMPHYGLIEPTEFAVVPRAYIIPAVPASPPATQPAVPPQPPAGMPTQGPPPAGMGGPGVPGFMRGPQGSPAARTMAAVVDRLEGHGVKYFKTTKEMTLKADRYRVGSTSVAANEYQGSHRLRTVTGAWESTEQSLPAGSLVVTLDQPLARLVFMLLDPASDDGFMTWNILDPLLGTTPAPEFYPVWRTLETVSK